MRNIIYIILGIGLSISACTKSESDTFDQFFFRNDGADLFVEVNGNIASKTFILLLHGGPGGSGTAYNEGYYADQLEKDYAMIYLDQRGNGASTGSYQRDDLTLSQNSDDIYEFTRFLKAKYGQDISLFLAGHSWGGLTSCHALVNTEIQNELKGWIEIDGAHDFVLNDIEAIKLFKEVGQAEIDSGFNVAYWTPVLERVNQIDPMNISDADRGYLNATAFEAEAKLRLGDPTLPSSGPSYPAYNPTVSLASMVSNNFVNPILNEDSYDNPLTDRLGEITIPSLFLWGKFDLVVPPALGVSAVNRIGSLDKGFALFQRSGHSPMNNEPELFVEVVKDFVELYK